MGSGPTCSRCWRSRAGCACSIALSGSGLLAPRGGLLARRRAGRGGERREVVMLLSVTLKRADQ